MKTAAPEREAIVLVVAALAVAAVEICAAAARRGRLARGRARYDPAATARARSGARRAPARAPRTGTPARTAPTMQVVREHRVEVAGQLARRRATLSSPRRAPGKARAPPRVASATVSGRCAGTERAEAARPRVVGVGLDAHLRHRPRHVDRELVRRRVLAGVQAGAAVVAQVGQVVDVGLAELEPARHRREDGAEAFAVAAGIADLHLRGRPRLRSP